MPVTPGQAVVGQVVKAAQRGDSKMREGEHVAGPSVTPEPWSVRICGKVTDGKSSTLDVELGRLNGFSFST
jgi:hypothetical protein